MAPNSDSAATVAEIGVEVEIIAADPSAMNPAEMTPSDMTMPELRLFLAPMIAQAASFDGWSKQALADAAKGCGADEDVALYAFTSALGADGGSLVAGRSGDNSLAMNMIAAWIDGVDAAMAEAWPQPRIAKLKIRERITTLILFRLEAMAPQREALRRAQLVMARPENMRRSMKLGWHSADIMWQLAGDSATDYNYYTKRSTLGLVYASVLAIFIQDDSENFAETRAFLDRRIENVMQFEKAKAAFIRPSEEKFSVARFLGRLRYPAS